MKNPTTLIIMDGYGLAPPSSSNAISVAETPVLDNYMHRYPHATLAASGVDVGLPAGQMGNSEVGHTNIGAGRIVQQDFTRISGEIENGRFSSNQVLLNAMNVCKESGKSLHLMGLLSSGGVHSHVRHLWAILEMAKSHGLRNVFIHCFMDGRDDSPHSGVTFISECLDECGRIGVGRIASVVGRFYAMDRDSRWDRVEAAYNLLIAGEGQKVPDPISAVQASYDDGVTDEFIQPVLCTSEGLIRPGDSVIFFNFRPDRAREITRAFVDPEFSGFQRKKRLFSRSLCLHDRV